MALVFFLALLLILVLSQFYTSFFIEVGLVLALFIVFILPTMLIVFVAVFPARDDRQERFIQLFQESGKILIAQVIYLLVIYIFLINFTGFGFLSDLDFWIVYLKSYHLGYLQRFLQDILAGYALAPILMTLTPSLISCITFTWTFYWVKRLILFMKK